MRFPVETKSLSQIPPKSEIRNLIQAGYQYAFSLTHHRHDAEDLIQQACLKTLRANEQLISKRYLFVAIRNLFIDRNRSRSELQLSEPVLDSLVDPAQDHVSRVGDRMEVKQLLARLRPQEREALYLNCVESYTADEIAELTGQPRGTVLSHLLRAKKRLRRTDTTPDRVDTK